MPSKVLDNTEALYIFNAGTPVTANFYGFNIPISGSQELRFVVSAPTGHTINCQAGSDPANQLTTSSGDIVEIPVTVSSDVTQFTITDTAPGGNAQFTLYGLKVDGVLLVNEGTQWDTSYVWSDLLNIPTPTGANYPKGTFTGVLPAGVTPDNGNVATINSNTDGTPDGATLPVTLNNSTVRVYYKQNPSYSRLNTLTAGDQTSITEVSLGIDFITQRLLEQQALLLKLLLIILVAEDLRSICFNIKWMVKRLQTRSLIGIQTRFGVEVSPLGTQQTLYLLPHHPELLMVTMALLVLMQTSNTAADCSVTFTPSQPIAVQNNIKVTWAINPNYRGYFFQINDEDPVEIDVYTKATFTLPFTGTLNTLTIYSTNSISTNQNLGELYAIEIDDELLVDQGNMGANGFYLPFDTTAKGTPDFPTFGIGTTWLLKLLSLTVLQVGSIKHKAHRLTWRNMRLGAYQSQWVAVGKLLSGLFQVVAIAYPVSLTGKMSLELSTKVIPIKL